MHSVSEEIAATLAQLPRTAALHAKLSGNAAAADTISDIPPNFFDNLDTGWLNTLGLESYCDTGRSTTCLQRCRLFEAFGHADPALAVAMPGPSLTLSTIKHLASPGQRQRICDTLLNSAPVWGAFALTEPTSGSNAARLSLTAQPVPGGFLLNGSKCYIGNAGRARYLITFATIDPSRGQFGVRAFLIWLPCKGIEIAHSDSMLGLRAVRISRVTFRDCAITNEQILGFGTTADLARSFTFALKSFDEMRPGLASLIVGAACGVVDRLTSAKFGSGKTRSHIEAVVDEFSGPIHSARLLCRHAAICVDGGANASIPGSICKVYATEQACTLIERVMGIPGIASHPSFQTFERLHRDFQAFRMMEGTRDIHHLMIARERNAHHMKLESQLQAARWGRTLAA